MVYANMVLAAGPVEFAERAAAAKASGVIVPDLPLEEQGPIREALAAHGLALIPLVAPTTPRERRARICASAEGFVYLVSTVGVTGERAELPGRAHRADRGLEGGGERAGRGRVRVYRLRSRRPPSGGSPMASSSAPGWCVLWRTPLMEMPLHPL